MTARRPDASTKGTTLSAPSTWLGLAAASVAAWTLATAAHTQHRRLAMLLVLAPLLEEIVFRAGLHEGLLHRARLAPALANGLTALAFGLAHVALRGDIAAFAVALPAWLIGVVYQRTGRLRGCVAMHAAMNAAWLGWYAAGPVFPGNS